MRKFPPKRSTSSRSLYRTIAKLCRKPLDRGVADCNADRCVKRYKSADFAMSMIAYFILGLHSLRELTIQLAGKSRLTEMTSMRGISKAQLPNLLRDRPSALWAPLVAELLGRIHPSKAPRNVWAIDATMLQLGCKLLSRMTGRDIKAQNAGAKLSAVINLSDQCLERVHVSLGSGHDAEHTDELVPSGWQVAGVTFVFDRGYRKYPFYRDLIRRGAHFVTRQCANDRFALWRAQPLDPEHPEIIYHAIGYLGGTSLPTSERILVCRVVKRCDDGTELVFLSTRLDLSGADIAATYHYRWQIEIFFRWLKSSVGLRRPLGYSLQAAEHTILAALVAYCLALLLADWETSPATGRQVARIASSIYRMRARLHEDATERELQAFGFI